MSGVVPAIPRLKFTNATGVPVVSGSVTVYLAGTTTLANTYQDKALTTLNDNPVPLDGNGEALFWLDPSLTYKFLLKDSLGATITGWPVDNILGGGNSPTLQQSYVDTFSGDGSQTVFTLSAAPGNIKDTNVYVGGVYQKKSAYTLAGSTLTFAAAPTSGTNNIEVTYYVLLDFTGLAATIAGYSSSASANATAAAASRAQMLYIVQGSFAPGTPPTHRDDGSAIQAGDYASFTDNLFRRYNGSSWIASDINTANLAASSGSSLVGHNATTIASALNIASDTTATATSSRRLRDLIEAWYPVVLLPQKVVIEKLRTDYPEMAVYTPITSDGIEWTRWLVTNRFNTSNSGSPRACLTTLAKLYASTAIAASAENLTTGTEAQTPLTTQATSGVTSRTGTWVGPATVNGFTDIIYSVTVADKAVYTSPAATGRTRLEWRAYRNSGNGGIAKVTVKAAGVEVASGLYCVPVNSGTDRTVDLKLNDGTVSGLYYVPLADGLDPAVTYTVELEVHSTNPVSGRLYDGGLREYAAIAYNATGRQGIFRQTALLGTNRVTYDGGSKAIYAFTGTRISWKYIATATGGIHNFKVFDSVGAEISAGKYSVTSVDTYSGAGSVAAGVLVASGLTAGTYYLQVTSGQTKNASATGYRMYDEGATSYNEGQAGVPGTDSFDLQGLPSSISNIDTSMPTGATFIGTGNIDSPTMRNRRTTDATGLASVSFSGGTHGNESAPTSLVYTLDGSTLDFAGGTVGQLWVGARASFSFATSLRYGTGTGTVTDTWADTLQELRWSAGGYSHKLTRTVTAAVYVYDDYTLMLMAPGGSATGNFANKGAGGSFIRWAVDSDKTYTINSHNDGQTNIDVYSRSAVTYNDVYGICASNSNESDVRRAYSASDASVVGAKLGLLQDRADGAVKYYNRAFRYDQVNGRLMTVGDAYTRTSRWRVIKLPGLEAMLSS